MAFNFQFQTRPTRNLRKRKLADLDINSDHAPKRRKKAELFSERSASGFCEQCTNPYKLITCKQCYRSFHINCLNQLMLKSNDSTQSNDNRKSSASVSIVSNVLRDITVNMPQLQLQSAPNDSNGVDDEIRAMSEEQHVQHKKNPKPIEIASMPLKSPQISDQTYLNELRKWFKNITPSITKQEIFHDDTFRKQILAIFVCSDCLHQTHQCFICKERNKIVENNEEIVQKCTLKHCSKYYHRSCLKEDTSYEQHTVFYGNGKVKCPLHHCWCCHELGQNSHATSARKTCWYCPRSYHRNCVPPTAELMSVQKTDSDTKIQRYPDFRYDLITCCWNDEDKPATERLNPCHPKPKDLQFGRDDAEAGIFKWQLWDGAICEFYQLHDDPFSLNVKMLNLYRARKKNSLKKQKDNPFPKDFKKIQRSRYSKAYKKPATGFDYGRCDCVDGCSLDWSCSNYGMDIECDDKNCGSRDYSLCENRQFCNTKSTDNVKIKKTKDTGFGAYATKDLRANQLIIEYVGEVITKQESNDRIHELNEKGSANFYFFQVDGKTVIDGTSFGNESRFLNHSCNANCYTGRWNVKGEYRLGVFASTDIKKGKQLTYDYQYEVPNPDDVNNLARCLCREKNCRIFLGFNKKKAEEWKKKQTALGNYPFFDEKSNRKKEKKKKKKKKGSKKKSKKKKKQSKKKKTKMLSESVKKEEKKMEIIQDVKVDIVRNNEE